jgi:hypothetical protein
MTPEELQVSITTMKQQLELLKLKIEEAVGSKEKRRPILKLKELQFLQLLHIGKMDAIKE